MLFVWPIRPHLTLNLNPNPDPSRTQAYQVAGAGIGVDEGPCLGRLAAGGLKENGKRSPQAKHLGLRLKARFKARLTNCLNCLKVSRQPQRASSALN